MRNAEITFDTATGIDLLGWWSNPATGESYEVVDQYMQDNDMLVKTRSGQLINFSKIQNFVHSDKPMTRPAEYIEPQKINTSKLLEGLDTDTATDIESEVNELLNKPIKSSKPSNDKAEAPVNIDTKILDKAFAKAPAPEISVAIDWNWKSLENTVTMLVETMEIKPEVIADYVCDKFMGDITASMKQQLSKILLDTANLHRIDELDGE